MKAKRHAKPKVRRAPKAKAPTPRVKAPPVKAIGKTRAPGQLKVKAKKVPPGQAKAKVEGRRSRGRHAARSTAPGQLKKPQAKVPPGQAKKDEPKPEHGKRDK